MPTENNSHTTQEKYNIYVNWMSSQPSKREPTTIQALADNYGITAEDFQKFNSHPDFQEDIIRSTIAKMSSQLSSILWKTFENAQNAGGPKQLRELVSLIRDAGNLKKLESYTPVGYFEDDLSEDANEALDRLLDF